MNRSLILYSRQPIELYEGYYAEQAGSGMPYYAGRSNQRGHGLGSIFGGLFRAALPLIRRSAIAVGKQALRTGGEIMTDISRGENVKQSFKRRAEEGADILVGKAKKHMEKMQTGDGMRSKVRQTRKLRKKGYKRDAQKLWPQK
jgi:hypothetical protein